MKTLVLALAVASVALSCAKSESVSPPNIDARPIEHRTLTGSLTSNTKKLLTGGYRASCDDKIENVRQEIAAALDARTDEIATLPSSGKSYYLERPFGPTVIHERVLQGEPPKDGWQEEKVSWEEIVALYQQIKGQPVSNEWRKLNRLFRGVVVDDLSRVVDGVNFQVTKDSEAPLLQLFSEVNDCLKDSACVSPKLSGASKSYLAGQLRLQKELKDVTAARDGETARRELDELVTWVATDYRFWNFRKNAQLKKLGDNEYEVPLDLGVFSPVAAEFARYFESVWKADGKKVKLKPQNSAAVTGVFQAILGKNPGGRSFVDRGNLKLTLEPGFSNEALAHEMGHVLGFRDMYFSVWDPASCGWTTQYREDDIMSDHTSGRVLELHWSKLTEEYN